MCARKLSHHWCAYPNEAFATVSDTFHRQNGRGNSVDLSLVYEDYIFADVRKRHDLAFAWLYQEYAYANGYLNMLDQTRRKDFSKYDDTLCRLLEYLQEKPDQRDG